MFSWLLLCLSYPYISFTWFASISIVYPWLAVPTWLGKFIVSSRGESTGWVLRTFPRERLLEFAWLPRDTRVSPFVSNYLFPKVSLENAFRERPLPPFWLLTLVPDPNILWSLPVDFRIDVKCDFVVVVAFLDWLLSLRSNLFFDLDLEDLRDWYDL